MYFLFIFFIQNKNYIEYLLFEFPTRNTYQSDQHSSIKELVRNELFL